MTPGPPLDPCSLCGGPRASALRVTYDTYSITVCAGCDEKLTKTRDRRRSTPAPRVESKDDALAYLRVSVARAEEAPAL